MARRPLSSEAARDFARAVAAASRIAKGPDLYYRRALQDPDQICILQRWNSHTPSLQDVWGRGYFLRWKGRGTIIDPGCSFIRLFRLYTPYSLRDVDMVLATHDHIDHCQDFGTLVSLLRAYNAWGKERGIPPHTWDSVMSLGVADQFGSILANRENMPYLRWRRVLPPRNIEAVPGLLHQSTLASPAKVSAKYSYKLKVLKAFHKELLGDNTSMGLRFTLLGENKSIVISGDTAISGNPKSTTARELVKDYRGASLLILHVGTMEKPGETRLPEHLGYRGVVEVLRTLAQNAPEVVVLTEWGYEFGRAGLSGRSRFTRLVVEELQDTGCNVYFPAVEGAIRSEGSIVPIIPADLNLRISLPDLKVRSDSAQQFVPAAQIRALEEGEHILFMSTGFP